tara:strand:+ start:187 stop:588 length:402 start_codon:yes stop_codon:yes gene_type:complete
MIKYIVPRKFRYEEIVYFGESFLIELTNQGLEVRKSTLGSTYYEIVDDVINLEPKQWSDFMARVQKLNLKPIEPEEMICDGCAVDCHITFYRTLVKFDIGNPNFKNFTKFRNLINDLTICEQYPKGLLYGEGY